MDEEEEREDTPPNIYRTYLMLVIPSIMICVIINIQPIKLLYLTNVPMGLFGSRYPILECASREEKRISYVWNIK